MAVADTQWHARCISSAVDTGPRESRLSQSHKDEPEYINQRFRLLIESLTDFAVFMIDLSGAFSSWNPGVEQVLGYNQGEFIGLPFASIFTPEDVALGRPGQELERARATGRSDDKRDNLRKDGSPFRADGVVTVIRNDAGVALAFSKVMRDVTAQQQASGLAWLRSGKTPIKTAEGKIIGLLGMYEPLDAETGGKLFVQSSKKAQAR